MRKAKITLAILAVLILAGFTYLIINSGVTAKNLEFKTIKLQSTEAKLKDINIQVEKLKSQTSTDQKTIDEQKAQQEKLEKEKQDLESQLQAKADAKAKLELAATQAEQRLTVTKVASAAPVYSGSHEDWMAQAGISPSDYGYVDYIVKHESGWNPNAVNASSGACGLGQQLPCGKWAGEWNDPIAALVAMKGYAIDRYGSWSGAYAHWIAQSWW